MQAATSLEPGLIPGVVCSYSQVSDSVVWSYCSGGHFMFAYRSTDSGLHFDSVGETTRTTPDGYPNGSTLAAASPSVAVAANVLPGGSLLRTDDGGATWTIVQHAPAGGGTWSVIGFTTPEVGYAFSETFGASYTTNRAQLWRTTDAGTTWSLVSTLH
jgi:hypothetical protein